VLTQFSEFERSRATNRGLSASMPVNTALRTAGNVRVGRTALLRARAADRRRRRGLAGSGHCGRRCHCAGVGVEVLDDSLRQWRRGGGVLASEEPAWGEVGACCCDTTSASNNVVRRAWRRAGPHNAPSGIVALDAGRPLVCAREQRPAGLDAVFQQEGNHRRQLFLLLFRLQVVNRSRSRRWYRVRRSSRVCCSCNSHW